MTIIKTYKEIFLIVLFNIAIPFNFEILEKNMKVKATITRIANKYIFELDCYRNSVPIEISEFTEIELKYLSNSYKSFIFELVKDDKKNLFFYFKLLFLLLINRKKQSKIFFSQDIITTLKKQSNFLEFVVTKDYLSTKNITIIPDNISVNAKYIVKYFHSYNTYLISQAYIKKLDILTKLIITIIRLITFMVPIIVSIPGSGNLLYNLITNGELSYSIIIFIFSIFSSFSLYIILKRLSKPLFRNLLLRLS